MKPIQKLRNLIASTGYSRFAFLIVGLGSTIWFLVRVIPKPSRAAYPCMRAAAPVMSSFVIYLIGLSSTIWVFRKGKGRLLLLKGLMSFVFVFMVLFSFRSSSPEAQFSLVSDSYFKANEPMGSAKGILPGRVVWVRNPDATNANMTNTSGDFWYFDKNCDQALVDSMLVSGIRRISGKANNSMAWEEIFRYFNQTHGREATGYVPGQKIAIKINLTNSCCVNIGNARMDASPQLVLSLLKQLIEVAQVPPSDIWIGDNYRLFRNEYWNKCHEVYPDVHYVDGTGMNGREKTIPSENQLLVFSDGKETSSIPMHYVDADYLINMGCLKSHDKGGITICAKNHQGSILQKDFRPEIQSAFYMHYALPVPPDDIQGTDKYRHLVDFMGHEHLGGKTLLYLVDGLWAGRNWEGNVEKWQMAPFLNDYPSSLFLSLDAVAIESVCFDFLLTEYASKPASIKYPYMTGVDDYLKQAADPGHWPSGITYDPEHDGTPLPSLGVYEHWNNPAEKKYSRNLGSGQGIELVSYQSLTIDNYQDEIPTGTAGVKPLFCRVFPNPFRENIRIETGQVKPFRLKITDAQGRCLLNTTITSNYTWSGKSGQRGFLPEGIYLLSLEDPESGRVVLNQKIIHAK